MLVEHGERWTAAWLARRAESPSAPFRWPEFDKKSVNHHLLPELLAMTADHCAYCDGWPFGEMATERIDHFKPKGDPRFLDLAFRWDNLFPACNHCQRHKGSKWTDALPKPDDATYSFERYFVYRIESGRLDVNPAATEADRAAALSAIEVFGLNLGTRPAQRVRLRSLYASYAERPYRFIYPAESG